MGAEGLTGKMVLDESPGRVADDHRIGHGEPLEASGDVRRLPQCQLPLPPARADLAHDDETRVDADTDGQAYVLLPLQTRIQARNGLDDLASCPDGTPCIILMGLGIAEVDEQ